MKRLVIENHDEGGPSEDFFAQLFVDGHGDHDQVLLIYNGDVLSLPQDLLESQLARDCPLLFQVAAQSNRLIRITTAGLNSFDQLLHDASVVIFRGGSLLDSWLYGPIADYCRLSGDPLLSGLKGKIVGASAEAVNALSRLFYDCDKGRLRTGHGIFPINTCCLVGESGAHAGVAQLMKNCTEPVYILDSGETALITSFES